MIQGSSVLKRIAILLFLSVFLFFGCTDKSDDTLIVSSEETESVSTLDAVPVANLEARTFAKLRTAFPGPLLDGNLKTLRALANSDIYLAFLSRTRVSKQIKPFQTFDEFLSTTPPDAEKKIRPILKQRLAHLVINDQDIASFHELATIEQSLIILNNFRVYPKPPHIKEAETRALKNAPFFRWFPPKEIEPHIHQAFWKAYVTFVVDANEIARKKIQDTLHKHGQDNGLIWLAIQEPRILGVLLNTFMDPLTPADFLRWIAPEGQEN